MDGITGSLKTMSPRDLVLFLGSRKLSGTLQVDRDGDRKTVEIRLGEAVMVSSSSPREYLSEMLVKKGYINKAQLQEAIANGGHPLGASLVAIGAVDEERLREVLNLKITGTLLQLMSWHRGSFRFVEHDEQDHHRSMVEAQVRLIELWRAGAGDAHNGWIPLHQMLESHSDKGVAGRPSAGSPLGSDFAEHFRREVEDRLSERGRGKRFPRDLQSRAVEYYRSRTQQGSFLSEVARELGLPPPTLRRWVLDAPPEPEPRGMHAATLSITQASESHGQPVLMGPGGLRVEGLDLDGLAQLLRRL